jgi:hypothetical protein
MTREEAIDRIGKHQDEIREHGGTDLEMLAQCIERAYRDDLLKEFDEILAEKTDGEILKFDCPVTGDWITVGRHQLEKIARFKRRAVNAETERLMWGFGGPEWWGKPPWKRKNMPSWDSALPVDRRTIWLNRTDENPFIAITAYFADSWFEEDFDRKTHPRWDVFMPSLLADPRCPANLRESPELLKFFTPQPIVKFFYDPVPYLKTPNRMIAITPNTLQRPAFLQNLTHRGLTGIASHLQH